MFTFFVNMQKRQDGKVYADLHKTDGRIYFSAKEAQRVIQANQEVGLQHRHVVEMVAMTMQDYEEQSKEIADLRAELAASQAREEILREMFLITVEFEAITPISFDEVKKQFLRLQQDDTALRQAIRAAKEEMRERCAVLCESYQWNAETCAAGIRALEVE